MVTRIYHCDKCDNELELQQRISDDVITNCPLCGTKEFHCIPQPPMMTRFIGPGFYCNTYRNDDPEEMLRKTDPAAYKRHVAKTKAMNKLEKETGRKRKRKPKERGVWDEGG